ncbi:hypothetical protein [Brevundimonas diminuta]|uniref:hypothetical protein n=1 Tax=Brevundimonas diminuta TaxID=293 RepID=UPI001F5729A1|nr:hypothetical protein [Brevundimonas diminuta]
MAAGLLAISAYTPARDRLGRLAPGARMDVYANRTTTRVTVYADAGLSTPLTNPVIANASGQFPAVWADSGSEESPALYTVGYSLSTGASIGNPSVFDDVQPSVSLDLVSAETRTDLTAGNVVDQAAFRSNIGLARASASEAKAGTSDIRSMTPLASKLQLRTVVEQINPREPQFAGGATVDGETDARAAVQAAIDYAKTLGSKFSGGCIKVKLPAGVTFFGSKHPTKADRVLDLTGCDNVVIEGEGIGATTLKFNQNVPLFKNDENKEAPLFQTILAHFTILGPYLKASNPTANQLADGIMLGATNSCFIDNVRVYACSKAMRWRDSFHTEIFNARINGQGDLACRDGFYADEGDPALAENAVGIHGGRIFGCGRYGFRGLCITGSSVFGLEVLGCGTAGVYFGEGALGKELKWFSWVGGLIDTCPDLLIVKRGSAALAHYLHFSGLWMGYASEAAPGLGTGVDFEGLEDCTFAADMLVNTDYAATITNCNRIYFGARTLAQYDKQHLGAPAIVCNNTVRSRFDIGTAVRDTGSPSATTFVEQGTSNRNLITGIFDQAVTTIGAQSNKTGTIIG